MAKPSPYKPSREELDGAPSKFRYELWMFRESLALLNRMPQPPNKVLYNVYMEVVLLHARNLLDFFTGKESEKDDIRASHFVSSGEHPQEGRWASSLMPYLSEHKDDINKHLSHLTYRRVVEKPEWNWRKIGEEIEAAYQEFLDRLPNTNRMVWKV